MEIINSAEHRSGFIRSFMVPLIVIILILMISGVFLAKTDGVRQFIADKMGAKLGLKVEISSSRIGLPYVLVLEDVAGYQKGTTNKLFSADRIIVFRDFRLRRHITIERGELTMIKGKDNDWLPHVLNRLGDVPEGNIAQLADTLDLFDKRIVLTINDSVIRWLNESGENQSSVLGLYFKMLPAYIPEHEGMKYFYLMARTGDISGKKFQGIEKEWLASKNIPYLELTGAVDYTKNKLPKLKTDSK